MSRYREAVFGVVDITTGASVIPGSAGWAEYQKWVANGNTPDPRLAETPVPLSERRARRKQAVRDAAHHNAVRGVAALSTRFALSVHDYALLVALLAVNKVPAGFAWRDVNGVMVEMGIAQVRTLVEAHAAREYSRLQRLWQLESDIDNNASPDLVDIAQGWPG